MDTKTEMRIENFKGLPSPPEPLGNQYETHAVAGVIHTAKMLEQILAELKKLNAHFAKQATKAKFKEMETR